MTRPYRRDTRLRGRQSIALYEDKVAEGTGFEPAIGFDPYNGLANRRLQPLGHPSTDEWNDTAYAGKASTGAVEGCQRAIAGRFWLKKDWFVYKFLREFPRSFMV